MDRSANHRLETQLFNLARNHRWTWDHPTADLLGSLPGADPTVHPVATIVDLSDADWAAIAAHDDLVARIGERHADLESLLASKPDWSDRSARPEVAYISAEFGISELVPQYSGGLGILAGDHLKSASDLNVPLVGVGLFYRQGFFRQGLDGNEQSERFETCDPERLGFVDTDVTVTVAVGTDEVTARVWRLAIGRVDLYALDTDLPINSPTGRAITDRLYSGDDEHRIRQELILGVGGLRALVALGLDPEVVHLNEGHAGFLLLERLRTHLAAGATWDEAVDRTRASAVFTTHTPVPAGIDRFDPKMVEPYIAPWAESAGVEVDTLLHLATSPDDDAIGTNSNDSAGDTGSNPVDDDNAADHNPGRQPFNMAALCLSLTGAANGVSELHGQVSRELFGSVPAGPSIGSVTNGVHARTWVSPEMAGVFDTTLGSGWDAGTAEAWGKVDQLDDHAVKAALLTGRRGLIDLISTAGIATTNLDPSALTIGFARRFATYKRADLLLTEPDRLARLLADDSRPIQFVFAGKAHPADIPGKALMARIVRFSRSPEANGRFIFVPDYEMAIARAMYAGCDVWLNNPIRPREASGTSGEKAALNGGLQFSILDGWWDEMYDGDNGWAIAASDSDDPETRDKEEARSIYEILEGEILPLFYSGTGRPTAPWLQKVRHNWITLGPRVTSARMVADYRDGVYAPALRRSRGLGR